ncbi:hypothetical protein NBRC116594_25200 [Shimia sp. NS0008-38b]|uniref:hypothetical protein n=1 Tax=Shimia sp. NS0008-38b TaxID=3127653 RepID=UPI003105FA8F
MKTELRSAETMRPPVRGAQSAQLTDGAATHLSTLTRLAVLPTATVYCEGNFAKIDGKTANGLVRHSEAYRVVSVIDSDHSGADSGVVLDGALNNIPIVESLDAAVTHETILPDTFIFGMAPSSPGET